MKRRNRGSTMLAMSGLIFVTFTICGTIMLRSLDTYHASATAQRRLQLLAAAEGAGVVYAAKGPADTSELKIGECVVTGSTAEVTSNTVSMQIRAMIPRPDGSSIHAAKYRALFATTTSGTELLSLERVP